jgi:protein O-mannosyl-transferase
LIYWNSLSAPFTFDDGPSIVDNTQIRQLWPLSQALSPPREGQPVAGRPLVNLSFAINYATGGLNVRSYHVGNVMLHVLCALLLFGVVRRTLRGARLAAHFSDTSATNLAFLSTLIWTVHPLQTETVDYISARTESMMGVFFLLTLYASIRAVGSPRRVNWLTIALLSCAMGMACKETMAVAPIVVFLYDGTFVFGSFRNAFRARGRFYGALAASWILLAALIWSGPRSLSAGFSTRITPWTYLLNQAPVLVQYLGLALWPLNLVLDYGEPQPLTLPHVAPHAALIVTLLLITVVALRFQPKFGFLGAWFFLILAPTSSFIPIATEVGAERRMYLPLAAMVVLVVVGGYVGCRRFAGATDPEARSWRLQFVGWGPTIAVLLVCGLLAAGTIRRNSDYQSGLTLWRTVLERRPHARAHRNVAAELKTAGYRDEVITHMRDAVRTQPEARYELGVELFRQGRLSEAIDELQRYIRELPADSEVIPAHGFIARALARQGRTADAEPHLRVILQTKPTDLEAHEALAEALMAQRKFDEARGHYSEVLKAKPDNAETLSNLGMTLAAAGRPDEARQTLRRAVELAPGNAWVHGNLADFLLEQRDFEGAVQPAEQAVRLAPRDPAAHRLLGLVLIAQLRWDDAIAQFQESLAIDPTNEQTRTYLTRALKLKNSPVP